MGISEDSVFMGCFLNTSYCYQCQLAGLMSTDTATDLPAGDQRENISRSCVKIGKVSVAGAAREERTPRGFSSPVLLAFLAAWREIPANDARHCAPLIFQTGISNPRIAPAMRHMMQMWCISSSGPRVNFAPALSTGDSPCLVPARRRSRAESCPG
jgi:hypothetical protein